MRQRKLYVGNLPFSVSEADIEQTFSTCGDIEHVKLITDRDTGRSRGFAFVTFSTQEGADQALSKHGEEMQGRKIVVSVAKERDGVRGRRPPRQ
jgi:heterogeneous nuclear ribonucleoprotein A1/A3